MSICEQLLAIEEKLADDLLKVSRQHLTLKKLQ